MSANMQNRYYEEGKTIEDFVNDRIIGYTIRDTAILNMCLTNGTMGRTDQLKLRELYPNLFDAIEKFLNQKKRGHIFVYEEEGKPKIVNFFIHTNPKENSCPYYLRSSALKSFRAYIRSMKIPSKTLVWINDPAGKHRRMIEDSIRYRLNWDYTFIALNETNEERN